MRITTNLPCEDRTGQHSIGQIGLVQHSPASASMGTLRAELSPQSPHRSSTALAEGMQAFVLDYAPVHQHIAKVRALKIGLHAQHDCQQLVRLGGLSSCTVHCCILTFASPGRRLP